MNGLPFPRAFVVGALRHCVWSGPADKGRLHVAEAFAWLGAADAWPELEALVALWGAAARRPIVVAPPCCPVLQRDEALFVNRLALVQCGREALAASCWQRDLCERAVGELLGHARRLAAHLESAGLLLDVSIKLPLQARPAHQVLH